MDNKQVVEVYVVYHHDADIKSKKVSVFTPMGMAILGKREQQVINRHLRNRNISYMLSKLLYQP